MNQLDGADAPFVPRRPPSRRLLRARRHLRADLVQLLCAAVGLALGLALPQVRGGPTVEGGRLSELLFTMGIAVIGVVSIVFSLLFGVVQWSASSFTPRLNLFRGDPLVWRTFGFAVGVFIFCVTAGLAGGNTERVSLVVPITAVLAVLTAFALIRALQTRAFVSLQLAHVLEAVAARGRAVIGDLYPGRSAAAEREVIRTAPPPDLRRTVNWDGPPCVVQQLNLRRLVDKAAHAQALVVFRVGVGDTVHEASPLADIHGGDIPDRLVRSAVIRGAERAFDQDPMLAVRLLADIALRALSPPGDPATAVDAVDVTEGLLRALAARELQVTDLVDQTGVPRVRLVLPTWEDYLKTGVEDLLPPAAPIPMVLERLERLLANVLEFSPPPRHPPLIRLSEQVQASLASCRPAPTRNPPPAPLAPRASDGARTEETAPPSAPRP